MSSTAKRAEPHPGALPGVSSLFRLRRAELAGWRVAALVSLSALVILFAGLRTANRTERIWVLSGAGGVYAGPLERMDRSTAFFHETALLASQAALQWGPGGHDLPELLKLYFHPRALSQLDAELNRRLPDIRARSLNSKPLVQSISDPVGDGAARVVEVRGLLLQSGQFAGRLLQEESTFTLALRFRRNPDLATSSSYPWQVSEFRLETGMP